MTRKSFLQLLGIVPAVPALAKLPASSVVAPETPIPDIDAEFIDSVPAPAPSITDVNQILRGLLVDRRPGALYDRVRLKAGATVPRTLRLFMFPLGQPDPYDGHFRTYADTNMHASGMLHAPYDILVQRVLFLFHPGTVAADQMALMRSFYYEWRILEKIEGPGTRETKDSGFWTAPLMSISIISEAEQFIDTDTGRATVLRIGEQFGASLGDHAKYIPPLVDFGVEMRSDEDPFVLQGDLDFYVFLDGIRHYPVY